MFTGILGDGIIIQSPNCRQVYEACRLTRRTNAFIGAGLTGFIILRDSDPRTVIYEERDGSDYAITEVGISMRTYNIVRRRMWELGVPQNVHMDTLYQLAEHGQLKKMKHAGKKTYVELTALFGKYLGKTVNWEILSGRTD